MKKINTDDLIDAIGQIDPELYMNEEPGTSRKRAKILRAALHPLRPVAAAVKGLQQL